MCLRPIASGWHSRRLIPRPENALRCSTLPRSQSCSLAMGQGFGLGFAVRTETGQNPLPGSTGSFYWTGSSGTTFFIDPKQQLIIIMMVQVPLSAVSFYRHEVRYLAYQALSAPD